MRGAGLDHIEIPYELAAFPDVPVSECGPRPITDGTQYSLICPACHGHFSVDDLDGVYRVRFFRAQQPQPTSPVPVVCDCGREHTGRPTDSPFVGCGAAWRLVP